MDDNEFQNFDKLMAELIDAKAGHAAAEKRESIARQETTAALNRLNDLQKKFDAVVVAIRKEAPRASDWARSREPRHPG